uniref:Insulin-like domain-containing protein n=1 Tax=Callorhinchus milii TaxID=7868 RepID=A0A4W3H648_CALMI|eukprot:gi/632984368/ref/XP_007909106.1/ PREDICTED: relaxin-3 isoform X2 [Callorhinchus milii]
MQKVVLVLALGVLLSELRPGAEGRSPGFGLKLCGREFLRAVIFTCGGSRWKRSGEKLEATVSTNEKLLRDSDRLCKREEFPVCRKALTHCWSHTQSLPPLAVRSFGDRTEPSANLDAPCAGVGNSCDQIR